MSYNYLLKIADHEIDGATLLRDNLTERMVEQLAPKMRTQCVLMNAIDALKKTVPGPIEMSIEMDDPNNGDIEIDVDESPLTKTAHVQAANLPTSCETILGPEGPKTDC